MAVTPEDVIDQIEKEIDASHHKVKVQALPDHEHASEAGRRAALLQARKWVWQITTMTDERLKP